MEKHIVKILNTFPVTHNVKSFRVERPDGYEFTPGQATEVSINKPGWEEKERPFTFTSLPEEEHLEFTIKQYPSHQGVTRELHQLEKDQELILHEVFGAIQYQGEGLFIAGGAGVTPFISILRDLHRKKEVGNNRLIFGNLTRKDIILEDELKEILGKDLISVLSGENAEGYLKGLITKDILETFREDHHRYFYVCGPEPMMNMVLEGLSDLGVGEDSIVREDL
ncbi:MAG: flavodoxin reductase [Bacteroidota bacterium]